MKKKQKSLKLNFIMNIILTMSSLIFPLITFPYVSRILLPEGTGKVSLATSFISYFLLFAQLGIPTYGVRVCARVRDDKEKLTRTVHELLAINFFMTIIAYIVFAVVLWKVPKIQEEKVLYIVISTTIFLTSIGMEWMYKALEEYTYITVRSIIFKFFALISMFLLVHEKNDYIIYGGISIFAASASNIFNFINAHKYIYMHPIGNYEFKKHFKPVAIFFAMACATTIYTNMDTVMLGFIKSDIDVGYYNAAVKIKGILVSVVASLGTVLLPRTSYYVQKGEMDKFWSVTQKAINFVFVVSLPLALFFILFAKQGIFFLSGSAYEGSIVPMMIIMPTLVLIGLTNILGIQILVPLGHEKIILYSEIVGVCLNLIINIILIPKYASVGAAIGTLIAELSVLIVQFIYLKERVWIIFKRITYWKLCIAMILASNVYLWINKFDLRSFATLLLAAIIFFSIYGGILLLTKEKLVIEIYGQIIERIKIKIRRI